MPSGSCPMLMIQRSLCEIAANARKIAISKILVSQRRNVYPYCPCLGSDQAYTKSAQKSIVYRHINLAVDPQQPSQTVRQKKRVSV